MNSREARKIDFLKRPMPHQLGELAAALSLLVWFITQHPDRPDLTQIAMDEPSAYAEWLIPQVSSPLQTEITKIYASLQEWQRDWIQINANEVQRRTISKQVREWSDRILDASGLVEPRREVA
ncbi:MAG TPA: hypothetical protein VFZ34_22910 [Blastocatellia bacterium]|nr:hypothetical protein [Blastocatellia bacterium]